LIPVAVVVLIAGGAGLARASLDQVSVAESMTSSVPALLGPINSLGRSGWDCAPEKAARAATPMRAELLSDQGK
jgi:hypothetical protein